MQVSRAAGSPLLNQSKPVEPRTGTRAQGRPQAPRTEGMRGQMTDTTSISAVAVMRSLSVGEQGADATLSKSVSSRGFDERQELAAKELEAANSSSFRLASLFG